MEDKKKYFTRMGDGSIVYMTEEEIRADILAGVMDAADRGKIAPLTEADMNHIMRSLPCLVVLSELIRRMPS